MSGELDFIMKWFGNYYRECPPPPPERFGRREFAFMFFGKDYIQRHLSFSKVGEMQDFFPSRIPSHAYHSSAYYATPGAPTMEEKSWLGADLIFDLDADHIRGVKGLSYPDMLARVKKEFIRLVDDFLMGDLGFGESELRLVFSGGRGYHAHVSAEEVLQLKSHERREIVDYITGTDLDIDWAFEERATYEKRFGDKQIVQKGRIVPSVSSGGWRLRMREGLDRLLDDLRALDVDEMRVKYPSTIEVSDKRLESLGKTVRSKKGKTDVGDLILEKGNLEDLSQRDQILLLAMVEQDVKSRMAGQVDEPVTSDIKRLIRMPGSLHGKTSLRVTELTRSRLEEFDPLRDAVPRVFSDDPVTIFMNEKQDVRLRGERFVLEDENEVPAYVAMFFLCRRQARLKG
ncbi:MAG TPA: DNA primase catalytic subunit PriS [Methanomassiliicoccales archaeon]|nr:DNA primase catalytic subunit PriS [Methanomassiliicoccales archaeon]